MTTAADLLRQALADAPDGLHVARDGYDQLDLFDGPDLTLFLHSDRQRALRLVGLLLAAAPHLLDMLSPVPACSGIDCDAHVCRAARAITEAAQAMEAES